MVEYTAHLKARVSSNPNIDKLKDYANQLECMTLDYWLDIHKHVIAQLGVENGGLQQIVDRITLHTFNNIIADFFANKSIEDTKPGADIIAPCIGGYPYSDARDLTIVKLTQFNNASFVLNTILLGKDTSTKGVYNNHEAMSIRLELRDSRLPIDVFNHFIAEMIHRIKGKIEDAVVNSLHARVRGEVKDRTTIMTGIKFSELYDIFISHVFPLKDANSDPTSTRAAHANEFRDSWSKFIVDIALDIIMMIGDANGTPTSTSVTMVPKGTTIISTGDAVAPTTEASRPVLIAINILVPVMPGGQCITTKVTEYINERIAR